MTIRLSATLANARGDTISATVGASGKVRIYSGTQPANVAAAITGTILAELPLSATAAGATANGVTTFNAITTDSSADNTGTATHFRVLQSNGTTGHIDGSVGTSGADMNLNTTSIIAGGPVAISSWTLTDGNYP